MTTHLEALTAEVQAKRSEKYVLWTMMGHLNTIEKNMNTSTSTRPPRTHAKARQQDVEPLLESLGLDELIPKATRQGIGGMPKGSDDDDKQLKLPSIVQSLGEAARRRKEAVRMLVDAVNSGSEVEDELEKLEERIAEARSALEEVTR
jgi:hypothetical protein